MGQSIVLLCATHIGGYTACLTASSIVHNPILEMQDVNWLVPRTE